MYNEEFIIKGEVCFMVQLTEFMLKDSVKTPKCLSNFYEGFLKGNFGFEFALHSGRGY